MRLFGHTFDHDYYFELPSDGERDWCGLSTSLPFRSGFAPHRPSVRATPSNPAAIRFGSDALALEL